MLLRRKERRSADFVTRCPKGHRLQAGEADVGKMVSCRRCATPFIVERNPSRQKPKQAQRKSTDEGTIPDRREIHAWDLDRILFDFGDADPVRLRELTTGVLCLGRTGSGKTSSVLPLVLGGLLRAPVNAGGLFCCVKNEDAGNYLRIFKQAGRLKDVVRIHLDGEHVFNFLQYEREQAPANLTNSVVELFGSISELADRNRSQSFGDTFFRNATRTAVRNAVDALILSGSPVALPALVKLVTSVPNGAEQLFDERVQQESYCVQVLELVEARLRSDELTEDERTDYELVANYFYRELCQNLHPKTKGGIISGFTSVADVFTRSRFRRLFCGERNTVDLTHAWKKGKLFLIDIPVEEHQESGKLANLVFKRMFQRTVQRRVVPTDSHKRPIVLCTDEYSQLCDPDFDTLFSATCRSKRCVNFQLIQSIDLMQDVCGSKEKAHAVLQNLGLKFLLANDGESARYCSELIGKRWSMLEYGGTPLGNGAAGGGHGGATRAQVEYLLPTEFFDLRTGGPLNDNLVDAIVFQGGKSFSTKEPYRRVEIPQQ